MELSEVDRGRADLLVELVARATHIRKDSLFKTSRGEAAEARARQIAMYLAHVALGCSLTKVGRFFGRDKTTVAYAIRIVEDLRDDPEFEDWLQHLEDAYQNLAPIFSEPARARLTVLLGARGAAWH
tara:strand:- start:84 stop:464 length:381 start_codon:yes stop_codon:yes gene_type:complete